jgi:hypothetical protein
MKAFSQYLNEIGDSRKPYPYTLKVNIFDRATWGEAEFKSDSKQNYSVDLYVRNGSGMLIVSFKANQEFNTTNAGLPEAFRVMATVIKASKEFIDILWKEHEIKLKYLTYETATVGKNSDDLSYKKLNQRNKLYLAFIKKELPGAKISQSDEYTKITLPKNYYK